MIALEQSPEKYESSVVVVRALLFPAAVRRGAVYELQVMNEKEAKPKLLQFLTTREIPTQLGELPPIEQTLPVRLTCRVGRRSARGTVPIRVTRVDFVGRGNKIVKTIPSDEGADDPLVALNRGPEKYVGQTLTVQGIITPPIERSGQHFRLNINQSSTRRTGNLCFLSSAGLASQIGNSGLWADSYPVRVSCRVEQEEQEGRQLVTVLALEFLDANGQVLHTFR